MEVDQVVKLLDVTSSSRRRRKKSSSKRPKKSFFDSVEERFFIILIFSFASAYIYLYFTNNIGIIHNEMEIFYQAHSDFLSQYTKKQQQNSEKTEYELFIEEKEFKVDFDHLEGQELQVGARKPIDCNYKQMEILILTLKQQRETNSFLQEQAKKFEITKFTFNDNSQIYLTIIQKHFDRSFVLLSEKISHIISELNNHITLLIHLKNKKNISVSKLLDQKTKSLLDFKEEVVEILSESVRNIEKTTPFFDLSRKPKKEIPAKYAAYQTFFDEIYKNT